METTITKNQIQKTQKFFKGLAIDIDFNYAFVSNEVATKDLLIDLKDLDHDDRFYHLEDILNENQMLVVEVTLYSRAISYLAENDPSLKESLEIAHEYGYTVSNIHSELLASLLATRELSDEWNELQDEINAFFAELLDI